ncbi:phage scaffolding protein [Streptomyces sp. NPDC020141]|uniref:phage scaffolding protein n=1 Tax=Streptomyces sp. NPDC020141 TaxID=3365065 RepID=UPI00378C1619
MSDENTETQVSDNDTKAMQAQLKKANSEAAHYRNERNTLRDMVVSLKAERTLSEAGITNPKATKVLDFSKITVTESGELEGLTEQLETLKEDFPELFGAGSKKISGGADASNKKEASPQKSSAEILAARFNS